MTIDASKLTEFTLSVYNANTSSYTKVEEHLTTQLPVQLCFASKYYLFVSNSMKLPQSLQRLKPSKFKFAKKLHPSVANQQIEQTNVIRDERVIFPPPVFVTAEYLNKTSYEDWCDKVLFVKPAEMIQLGVNTSIIGNRHDLMKLYKQDIQTGKSDGGMPVFTADNNNDNAPDNISQMEYIDTWYKDRQQNMITDPFNNLGNEISHSSLGSIIGIPTIAQNAQIYHCFGKEWADVKDNTITKHSLYLIASSAGAFTGFHVDHTGTSVWYKIDDGLKYFVIIKCCDIVSRIILEYSMNTFDYNNNKLIDKGQMNQDSFNVCDILEIMCEKWPQFAAKIAQIAVECYALQDVMLLMPSGHLHCVYSNINNCSRGKYSFN